MSHQRIMKSPAKTQTALNMVMEYVRDKDADIIIPIVGPLPRLSSDGTDDGANDNDGAVVAHKSQDFTHFAETSKPAMQ